jgi:hypothetical protein
MKELFKNQIMPRENKFQTEECSTNISKLFFCFGIFMGHSIQGIVVKSCRVDGYKLADLVALNFHENSFEILQLIFE